MSSATFSAHAEVEARILQPGIWTTPPALIKCLFIGNLIVVALAVISHAAGTAMGFGKVDFFRLGQENNLPTWYSSSQLLMGGLALGLFAYFRSLRTGRFDWRLALPPAFFLFLSLDETASMHERVGMGMEALLSSLSMSTGLRVGTWTLVCGPLFLIGLFIVARLTREVWNAHPRVKWKLAAGFAICFVSAVGGELFMAAVPPDSFAEKAETLLEELGEMMGITILLWACLDLLSLEASPSGLRRNRGRTTDSD